MECTIGSKYISIQSCIDIREILKYSNISGSLDPFDELSPRHSKRRADALFTQLKKKAEVHKIVGKMLHRNYRQTTTDLLQQLI